MEVTKLSSKGQIVLPKTLRDAYKWRPGTKFAIEEAADGLLLRPLRLFAPTRLEDVIGCLPYKGKPKTLSQMEKAIGEEVKARHGRGRY
jgi:AbrB family looped-hinge helix DNA binding protein